MVNSKRKGSKNERGISNLFTDWTEYKFSRTPQSGGLGWHNKLSTGDIICIDENHMNQFPLSIEAKFHSELDFSHLIDGTIAKSTNKVIVFWDQCSRDAKHDKKIPCLFMRRNAMKKDMHFVAIPLDFFILLRLDLGEWEPQHGYLAFQNLDIKMAILNSNDFFDIPYKIFYSVADSYRKNVLFKRLIKKK
jgi:hypothetical protein